MALRGDELSADAAPGLDEESGPPGEPAASSADTPPVVARRPLRWAAMTIAPVVGLVLFFGVWELYVRLWDVRRTTLPTPTSILRHVVEEPGFYWKHAQITLKEAAAGFGISFSAALLIATLMVHSTFIEKATMPVIVLVQSTPVVVIAPVFLIWFGFSDWPKILIAALICFVPFVMNAFTGLRSIDAASHELFRSVSASRWEIFFKLRLPHSLSYLFAAGRICVGLSIVGAVVGEFFGGSTGGLGNTARTGQARLLIDQLWGSIFVLAFMGITLYLLLVAVEARVLRWHSSHTRSD